MFELHPYQGNDPYIFVSYSHKDKETVYRILETMQKKGYRLWYDEGIDPGTEWADTIASRIKKCKYFFAFVSRNYLKSENCKDELSFSKDRKRNCLLIYLEDVALSDGMAMRMNRTQSISKHKYKDESDFYKALYSQKDLSDCATSISPPTVIPHRATILYPNGDCYTGDVNDMGDEFAPDGQGKYTFANGDVYEGSFECGFHIYGKMTYVNGDVYEGEWSPIEIHEENCNLLGENEKNGKGVLYYANGDEYDGSWLNGKRHGLGSFSSLDKMYVYAGEWLDDKKHGVGTIIYADKTIKKGRWENDELTEWFEGEPKLP